MNEKTCVTCHQRCSLDKFRMRDGRWFLNKCNACYKIEDGERLRYMKYGVSKEQFDNMIAAQENQCAICSQPNAKRALCIDHDHKTGEIRGLLCDPCNKGIGFFNDRPELLIAASEYLHKKE